MTKLYRPKVARTDAAGLRMQRPAQWPADTITDALTEIGLPAGVLDEHGLLRWVNGKAVDLFGDQRGRAFHDVVAPESREWAKLHIAKLLVGGQPQLEWRAIVIDKNSRRFPAEFHSVPLKDGGEVIGVFGIARVDRDAIPDRALAVPLTPRQLEVLAALGHGSSTKQISESLGLSTETVRNYVGALLRALQVHSRLEAVAQARRLGLL